MKNKLLNSKELKFIGIKNVKKFSSILSEYGFDSNNLLKLFGKEVTRHINIDVREQFYLRTQVLHDKKELLVLIDLFLLSKKVTSKKVIALFGKELFDDIKKSGLFVEHKKQIKCNAFLTPIENKLFLNDGDKFNHEKYHVIQIVLEQSYLIKSIKKFANTLLEKSNGSVLDLCTGSGVIGQSVLPKKWTLKGIDINPRALDYSKFNLQMNNISGNYEIADATRNKFKEKYDLIVANPPYNAIVPTKGAKLDLTLHSGINGDEVVNACNGIAKNNLKKNGMYLMCGTILFKDNLPADKTLLDLSKKGTLVILHQAISFIDTWEGMRLLYSCTPEFLKIKNGQFKELSIKNKNYNQVAWAIIIFKNNGISKIKKIYNHATDAILISKAAENQCIKIFS